MIRTEPLAPAAEVREQRDQREEFRLRLREASTSSIKLAWVLSDIKSQATYRKWGHSSFNEFIGKEGKGLISKSHSYALAMVGTVFARHQDEVMQIVNSGAVGIRTLMNLSSRVERGLNSVREVMHHLKTGEPLAGEDDGKDSEKPEKITIHAPTGDVENMKIGIMKFAIRNQMDTVDDAIRGMALEQFADPELPPGFEKHRDLIDSGTFNCKLCGKIPMVPTLHHVIPRSRAQGHGPLELLCWEPCHERIVQPQWRFYATKWGYDVDQILLEVDEKLRVEGKGGES